MECFMKKNKEWFGEWFDSPYYHILYKNRNHTEAQEFIDELIKFFKFHPEDHILDLACGKGRHSIYLNQCGYQVTGIDLSPQNISYANQFKNDRLHFYKHDMRKVFDKEKFHYILNLFTSFGYFDTQKENQKAIIAAATALKKGGKLLIDFLNPYKVVEELIPYEEKEIDGILFKLSKWVDENNFIIKNIAFKDQDKDYTFQERVKGIRKTEFLHYFREAGLQLVHIFGDYQLNSYEKERSERMIFVLEK
jgi:SAM-dependent methyltransferase